MSQTHGLRIAGGVRWRAFTDGVVVYVAETCETHLLPPQCAGLFGTSGTSAQLDGVRDADPGKHSDTASPGLKEPSDNTLQALVDLKIFDPIN